MQPAGYRAACPLGIVTDTGAPRLTRRKSRSTCGEVSAPQPQCGRGFSVLGCGLLCPSGRALRCGPTPASTFHPGRPTVQPPRGRHKPLSLKDPGTGPMMGGSEALMISEEGFC